MIAAWRAPSPRHFAEQNGFHAAAGGSAAELVNYKNVMAGRVPLLIILALSIDYYVFLVTRMREEYVRTQSNPQAVTFGIEKTGRIVTEAAAIMIGTFLACALTNFVIVQELGIGLCAAILVDATLVRLVLLPAVMRLFGDCTWFIPSWLDDRMPTFDIEGAGFERERPRVGSCA